MRRTAWGLALDMLPDRLLLELKKRRYLRVLKRLSSHDDPEFAIVRRLVRAGEAVVDVGANFGPFTRLLSEWVSPSGRVLSFEPIPDTFAILAWCCRRLRLRNVRLYNCALSDTTRSASMEIPRYPGGGLNYYESRITPNGPKHDRRRHRAVQLRLLDSFLDDLQGGTVSFVKCDVEGHEWEVVQGARRLIDAFSPSWLIEVSTDPDRLSSTGAQLFRFLAERGYRVFWVDGSRLRERSRGDRSTNYFFLTETHLRRLAADAAIT
jgi:FkbM family methyltransferase